MRDDRSIEECFRVLQLDSTAPFERVKLAHRRLVRELHPDQYNDKPRLRALAEDDLKSINSAYDELRRFFENKNSASGPTDECRPRHEPRPRHDGGGTDDRRKQQGQRRHADEGGPDASERKRRERQARANEAREKEARAQTDAEREEEKEREVKREAQEHAYSEAQRDETTPAGDLRPHRGARIAILAAAFIVLGLLYWVTAAQQSFTLLSTGETRGHVIRFNSASNLILAAGPDDTLGVWEIPSGKRKSMLVGSKGSVMASSISPSSRLVATGGHDNVVRVWETASGRLINALQGHKDAIFGVAFSPDESFIVSSAYDGVCIWDVATGALRQRIPDSNRAKYSSLSLDGTKVAYSSADSVRVYDLVKRRAISEIPVPQKIDRQLDGVHFCPDGQALVSVGRDDGTASLWDIRHQLILKSVKFSSFGTPDFAVRDDCQEVAVITTSDQVKLFSILSSEDTVSTLTIPLAKYGSFTEMFKGYDPTWIIKIAISPDGGWVGILYSDGVAVMSVRERDSSLTRGPSKSVNN